MPVRAELIGKSKYTGEAQTVLNHAESRARLENSSRVELKHLVPELIEIGWLPPNRKYLKTKGIDLDYLDKRVPRKAKTPRREIKYSKEAERVLSLGEEVAIKADRYDISTRELYEGLMNYVSEKPIGKPSTK